MFLYSAQSFDEGVRGLHRLLIALVGAITLACGLLLLGFFAFTYFLAWWIWLAAFLASAIVGVLYAGRRLGLLLSSMSLFFVASIVCEYLILASFLAPRLN